MAGVGGRSIPRHPPAVPLSPRTSAGVRWVPPSSGPFPHPLASPGVPGGPQVSAQSSLEHRQDTPGHKQGTSWHPPSPHCSPVLPTWGTSWHPMAQQGHPTANQGTPCHPMAPYGTTWQYHITPWHLMALPVTPWHNQGIPWHPMEPHGNTMAPHGSPSHPQAGRCTPAVGPWGAPGGTLGAPTHVSTPFSQDVGATPCHPSSAPSHGACTRICPHPCHVPPAPRASVLVSRCWGGGPGGVTQRTRSPHTNPTPVFGICRCLAEAGGTGGQGHRWGDTHVEKL